MKNVISIKKVLLYVLSLILVIEIGDAMITICKSNDVEIKLSYNQTNSSNSQQTDYIECIIKNNSKREIILCELTKYKYDSFYFDNTVFEMPFEVAPMEDVVFSIPITFLKSMSDEEKKSAICGLRVRFVMQMAFPQEKTAIMAFRNHILDKICSENIEIEAVIE